MRRFHFTMTAASSLLMHTRSLDGDDRVREWIDDPANKGKSKAGDDRTPPWKWMTYLYHHEGLVRLPDANLMAMLEAAGHEFRIRGNKHYGPITQTAVFFEEPFPALLCNGDEVRMDDILALETLTFAQQSMAVKDLGFQLDVRTVVMYPRKVQNVRVRPSFKDWSVAGIVTIDDSILEPDKFREIFDYACRRIGACDWRPGARKPGTHGRSELTIRPIK